MPPPNKKAKQLGHAKANYLIRKQKQTASKRTKERRRDAWVAMAEIFKEKMTLWWTQKARSGIWRRKRSYFQYFPVCWKSPWNSAPLTEIYMGKVWQSTSCSDILQLFFKWIVNRSGNFTIPLLPRIQDKRWIVLDRFTIIPTPVNTSHKIEVDEGEHKYTNGWYMMCLDEKIGNFAVNSTITFNVVDLIGVFSEEDK